MRAGRKSADHAPPTPQASAPRTVCAYRLCRQRLQFLKDLYGKLDWVVSSGVVSGAIRGFASDCTKISIGFTAALAGTAGAATVSAGTSATGTVADGTVADSAGAVASDMVSDGPGEAGGMAASPASAGLISSLISSFGGSFSSSP